MADRPASLTDHRSGEITTRTQTDQHESLLGPVTIQDYPKLHEESDRLEKRLTRHPGIPPATAENILGTLAELASNALDHGWRRGAENGVRLHVWLTEEKESVILTVEDQGRGIPETMRTIGTLALCADDRHLLGLATRLHATSSGDPERGCGLAYAAATARKTGGTLLIRSGRAELDITADEVTATVTGEKQRGTTVRLEMPLANPGKSANTAAII